MSGHSKWSNIKHRKGAQDAKRAKVFTKLLKVIQIAVREGGSDPVLNAKLRLAIDRAKSFNVPNNTIDRALNKDDAAIVEEVTLDAIGPGSVQIIIECATDNRKRSIPEIRSLLEKSNGKLAQDGAARWAFLRTGIILLEPEVTIDPDELLLDLIDAGAKDIETEEGSLVITTEPDALMRVEKLIREKNLPMVDVTLGWIPTQTVDLSSNDMDQLTALIDALDDHDDIVMVWSNASA